MAILRFLFKCRSKTLVVKQKSLCSIFFDFKKCLIPISNYSTKSIMIVPSFKISYLKDTVGLSDKQLLTASNLLHFESTEKPDSVLKLFQCFGFSPTHITKIIASRPRILLLPAQKCLKPKLDFLLSIFKSESKVIKIVTADPYVLLRSLNNQLKPCFNLLIPLLGGCHNALVAIGGYPSIHRCTFSSLVHKVELLRAFDVPHSQIAKMNKVFCMPRERIRNAVMKAKKMGFDPANASFVHAVYSMARVKESTWESKFQTYRSFGFSDDEILLMFKKKPQCMTLSVDKIGKTLEFYMTKLGWCPSRFCYAPTILTYSLKARIIPRCSVLQALASRNRISKNLNLLTIILSTNEKFLLNYVTPHKDQVPDVLDAFLGKLIFDEYNFQFVGRKQDATF